MSKFYQFNGKEWIEILRNGRDGTNGLDGKNAVVDTEELRLLAQKPVVAHEKKYDHSLLHDPATLGTKPVDENTIGDGKFLRFNEKTGKIVYDELPVTKGKSGTYLLRGGTSLPKQTGNSGKYLTTNGTRLSWGTIDLSGYQPIDAELTALAGLDSSAGLVKQTGAGAFTKITDNSSNWDTAYGWGNHASAGYWKSDGSSTATGNWSLGTYTLSAGPATFSCTTDNANQFSFSTWKTGTPGRNNFDGSLGFTFTPYQNITINQLGRYYGASNTQNHVVSVYNMGTSALVVRGTVLAASTSDSNGYKWVSIADTALTAGTIYAITVDESNGGDTWFDNWDATNYFNGFYINRIGYAYGSPSTFPSTTANTLAIYDTPAFRFVPSVCPQLTATYTGGPSAGLLMLSNGDAVLGLTKGDQGFSISKLGIGRAGVTAGYSLDVVGDTQSVGNFFLRQSASATGVWIRSGTSSTSPTNCEIRETSGYLVINSGAGPMLLNYNNSSQPVLCGGNYTITNVQFGIQPQSTTTKGLWIRGLASQNANLLEIQFDSTSRILTSITPAGVLTDTAYDAATNAVTNVLIAGHNSSGTPAAGFGGALAFKLHSSTTTDQDAGRIIYEWATATHGSRKAQLRLTVNDFNAERDALTATTSGSAVTLTSGGKLSAIGGFAVLDATNDTTRQMNIEHDTYTTTFYRSSNGGALAFGKSGNTLAAVDMTYVTGGITGLASMTLQTLNFAAVSAPSDTAAYISRPTTTEVRCYTARGGSFWTWYVLGSSSNNTPWEAMRLNTTGVLGVYTKHSTDNAVSNSLTISHNLYSATPASGFGQAIAFNLETSTTEDVSAGRIISKWATSTHGSQKAQLILTAYDTAEREGLRIEASGTAPMLGFYGASAVAKPSAYTQTYSTATKTHSNPSAIGTIVPMGELYFTGNTTATVITTTDTWTRVEISGTDGMMMNFDSPNAYTLRYTGATTADFHMGCTISVKSAGVNDTIKAVLVKNGTVNASKEYSTGTELTAGTITTKLGAVGDVTSTAIHVMTTLAQNDYVELFIKNTSDADDLTVVDMNIFAISITSDLVNDIANIKQVVNSLIDDLQALGLVG